MKKTCLTCYLFFIVFANAFTQNYITRNGNISFSSHTPLEDVNAQNNEVVSAINASTGSIDFKAAVKSFHFVKTAMEEHFNGDDYMASEKYPKAGFDGKFTNLSAINFAKDGSYNVTVSGNLTIRDVTKPITAKGVVIVKGNKLTVTSTFSIKRKDFNVIGESFVQKKISDNIQVTINCEYDKQ